MGRIDLSQAEAVMDLIRAKTDRAMNVALGQMEGTFIKAYSKASSRNFRNPCSSRSEYRLSRI